jgi:hypothetical protein
MGGWVGGWGLSSRGARERARGEHRFCRVKDSIEPEALRRKKIFIHIFMKSLLHRKKEKALIYTTHTQYIYHYTHAHAHTHTHIQAHRHTCILPWHMDAYRDTHAMFDLLK